MIAQLWLSLSITKLLSCHISNPFYPQIINYHEEDWFCVCVRPSWACQWTFNQSNDSKSDKKGTNWNGSWANTSSSPSATLAKKSKSRPGWKIFLKNLNWDLGCPSRSLWRPLRSLPHIAAPRGTMLLPLKTPPPPLETPGEKFWDQKFRWFLGPSDQNEIYHSPLLSKIWDIGNSIFFGGGSLKGGPDSQIKPML